MINQAGEVYYCEARKDIKCSQGIYACDICIFFRTLMVQWQVGMANLLFLHLVHVQGNEAQF